MFSCSKIEQKQLNTWVSFQSAEQPLLGQFSVSGNILVEAADADVTDALTVQGILLREMCQEEIYDP
ncbi:hypothetical protein MF6396_28195 [Pseudomonas sp. MF6396]|nr:hypothetical protein MF6396_28195 [Pseudomonas sp. MF6396]